VSCLLFFSLWLWEFEGRRECMKKGRGGGQEANDG
jgi:hypothetical protein